MKVGRLCRAAIGLSTLSLLPASLATATVSTVSGDSCSAVGKGNSYSLTVNVASASPKQYGFAVGAASGIAVQSIAVPGVEGSFLTSGLPHGASGTWVSSTPLTPGAVNVTVTTGGAVTSFSVLPASAPSPATYFDPIVCAVTARKVSTPKAAFTVDRRVSYDPISKAWRLSVKIADAGRVSAIEPELTIGTASSRSRTEKPLVQVRGQTLKSAGRVTLMLRPTARGQAMLATSGSIKLKLAVTFLPDGGTSGMKSISLVLKK